MSASATQGSHNEASDTQLTSVVKKYINTSNSHAVISNTLLERHGQLDNRVTTDRNKSTTNERIKTQ